MNNIKFITILLMAAMMVFTACDDSGSTGGSGDSEQTVNFNSADTPGETVEVHVGTEKVHMIYANDQTSIVFPFSPSSNTPVDNKTATLTRKFFMSKSVVTNALMVKVLQWAYDNGKFSTDVNDHNGIDYSTVKYGKQQLLDLEDADIKINYSGGSFSVDTGYENHPVVCITWFGAIMFCNWLTEMIDGNTDNVVYTGIDTNWAYSLTVEHADRTGYRLPSTEEWEYAARYIGTTPPSSGNLAAEYVAQNINSGHATLTPGYYWTPSKYASGAIKDTTNETETRAVSWYFNDPDNNARDLMPVGKKAPNQLGLCDMSGNVYEWCFNGGSAAQRATRGGNWYNNDFFMQVGRWVGYETYNNNPSVGFRIVRTQ